MEPYSRGLFLSFTGDALSLFFVVLILLVSLPSMIYSLGYLKGHYSAKKKAFNWFFTVIFVLSMLLVVSVRNAFAFLVAWEVMSLSSFFLVIFDTDDPKSVPAGILYIIMTHIGTAMIIIALLLMYKFTGFTSLDYPALKAGCLAMSSGMRSAVFLLLFLGFGAKAGIVPLHVWLPSAHPQAPSHISSIMSGVMIKTAIYGMLRFILLTLQVDHLWWGVLVTVVAGITCLTGIIYSLTENDLKRLLAYSSVENVGIILLGVGSSMVLYKSGFYAQSVILLAAGLFHLLNHAVFKGLLFLSAGNVYKATGTRNIERLGGLAKLMPWTSVLFLIGAMCVSALPPMNGFMSEWFMLRSLFESAAVTGRIGSLFFTFFAVVLALTGGLAAASFVKAFGLTFLAMPRSKHAEKAAEVPLSMLVPAGFLAACALFLGLFAMPVINKLVMLSGFLLGNASDVYAAGLFSMPATLTRNPSLLPGLVFLVLLSSGAVVFVLVRVLFGKGRTEVRRTWDCGYYGLTSRNEYSATGFTKPFRMIFGFLLQPGRKVQKVRETQYRVRSFKYDLSTTVVFNRYLYDPFVRLTVRAAKMVRKLQPGSIHLYLGYVLLVMVLLIVMMRLF